MESIALSKNNRVSAQKARLVANEVRGFPFQEAVDILKQMPQKSSDIILKTVYSAGANAKFSNPDVSEKDLFIKKITVDEGPTLKRFRARARGRGSRILKRTSSVFVVLSDES